MIKNDGQGHSYKYCDWCGKICRAEGVDTWSHNFCSERCKRAYDGANGTVDGGYKSGSIGHGIHNTAKKVENFLVKLFTIIIIGALVLGVLVYLFKK